jgi:hypothetical protein
MATRSLQIFPTLHNLFAQPSTQFCSALKSPSTAIMKDPLQAAIMKKQWLAHPSRKRSFRVPETADAATVNNAVQDTQATSTKQLTQPQPKPATTDKKRVRDADTDRVRLNQLSRLLLLSFTSSPFSKP